MHFIEFPYCCTGVLAVGFGESPVANMSSSIEVDERVFREELKRNINWCREMGRAFISATTNNQQRTINKILKEFGFKHTKWMSKNIHPETRVRIWWLPLK